MDGIISAQTVLARQEIAIALAEDPLGTHVFEAMAEADGPGELRWVVVSMPTSGGLSGKELRRIGGRPDASSPQEALDRLSIPADVQALISERLWPGASLVLSDYGLGESTDRTETGFVILTR